MRIRQLFFLAVAMIFLLQALGTGSTIVQTTEVAALDLEENDFGSFLTTYLDNVTAELPSSALNSNSRVSGKIAGTGGIITLGRVSVAASTVDYSRSEFIKDHGNDYVTLHSLSKQQIKQVVQFREFLAVNQELGFKGKLSAISSLTAMSTAANDTAERAGVNYAFSDSYRLKDILPKDESQQIQMNISDYTYFPQPLPEFYSYYGDLAKTSKIDDNVDPAEKQKYNSHVGIIPNIEFSMLEILKSNIAANYSTATNIIDPDDVTILDYDFNASDPKAGVMEVYISEHFATALKKVLTGSTTTTRGKIFGITLFTAVVPATALFPFSQVLGFAQSAVGKIGTAITTGANNLKTSISTFGRNLGTFVEEAPEKAMNYVSGLYCAGISAASAIPKTMVEKGVDIVNTFTNKTGFGVNLKEGLSNGAKLTTESIGNFVGTLGKSLTSFIPVIIVGGFVLVVAAVFGFLLYKKFMTPFAPGGGDSFFEDRFNKKK
ncbi:MAG: hypothetical protein ACFFD4_02580 [Candidatus Odinarchaeota archaeon]